MVWAGARGEGVPHDDQPSADASKRIGGNAEIMLVRRSLKQRGKVVRQRKPRDDFGGSQRQHLPRQVSPVVSRALRFDRDELQHYGLVAAPQPGMMAAIVSFSTANRRHRGIGGRGFRHARIVFRLHDFGCDFAEYLSA